MKIVKVKMSALRCYIHLKKKTNQSNAIGGNIFSDSRKDYEVLTDKYKWNKTWRYKHPETRYEGKARYYKKTQNAKNKGQRWLDWEIDLIMSREICDTELAKELGRSVGAIQAKRHYTAKMREGIESNGN